MKFLHDKNTVCGDLRRYRSASEQAHHSGVAGQCGQSPSDTAGHHSAYRYTVGDRSRPACHRSCRPYHSGDTSQATRENATEAEPHPDTPSGVLLLKKTLAAGQTEPGNDGPAPRAQFVLFSGHEAFHATPPALAQGAKASSVFADRRAAQSASAVAEGDVLGARAPVKAYASSASMRSGSKPSATAATSDKAWSTCGTCRTPSTLAAPSRPTTRLPKCRPSAISDRVP